MKKRIKGIQANLDYGKYKKTTGSRKRAGRTVRTEKLFGMIAKKYRFVFRQQNDSRQSMLRSVAIDLMMLKGLNIKFPYPSKNILVYATERCPETGFLGQPVRRKNKKAEIYMRVLRGKDILPDDGKFVGSMAECRDQFDKWAKIAGFDKLNNYLSKRKEKA